MAIKKKRRQKRTRQSIAPQTVPGHTSTFMTGDLGWATVGSDRPGYLNRSLSSDPKWQEKIAKLSDATGPYQVDRFPAKKPYINAPFVGQWENLTQEYVPRRQIATLKGYPLVAHASPSSVSFGQVDIARLDTLAKLGMLAKIRELEGSWNAPLFLGELKETIRMVRNPLGGLFKKARSYRRRARKIISSYRKEPGKMIDLLNNQYLQWTYGVSPLINDVKDAMSALSEFLTHKAASITRLQTTLKETVLPETWTGDRGGAVMYENGRIRLVFARYAELTSSVRYICGVYEDTQGPSTDRAIQLSGMDLAKSFAPTAYELLPYSFLLDYVSTVGSVVNGRYTHTGSVVWKCKNLKDKVVAGVMILPTPGVTGVPLRSPLLPHVRVLAKESFKRESASFDVGIKDIIITMPTMGQLINTLSLGFARWRSDDLDFGRSALDKRRF